MARRHAPTNNPSPQINAYLVNISQLLDSDAAAQTLAASMLTASMEAISSLVTKGGRRTLWSSLHVIGCMCRSKTKTLRGRETNREVQRTVLESGLFAHIVDTFNELLAETCVLVRELASVSARISPPCTGSLAAGGS
jgi:hypothetical protein